MHFNGDLDKSLFSYFEILHKYFIILIIIIFIFCHKYQLCFYILFNSTCHFISKGFINKPFLETLI